MQHPCPSPLKWERCDVESFMPPDVVTQSDSDRVQPLLGTSTPGPENVPYPSASRSEVERNARNLPSDLHGAVPRLVSGIGMAPEATGRWRPLHRVRASVSRGTHVPCGPARTRSGSADGSGQRIEAGEVRRGEREIVKAREGSRGAGAGGPLPAMDPVVTE